MVLLLPIVPSFPHSPSDSDLSSYVDSQCFGHFPALNTLNLKRFFGVTIFVPVLPIPRQQCVVEGSAGRNLPIAFRIKKVQVETRCGDKLLGDSVTVPPLLASPHPLAAIKCDACAIQTSSKHMGIQGHLKSKPHHHNSCLKFKHFLHCQPRDPLILASIICFPQPTQQCNVRVLDSLKFCFFFHPDS